MYSRRMKEWAKEGIEELLTRKWLAWWRTCIQGGWDEWAKEGIDELLTRKWLACRGTCIQGGWNGWDKEWIEELLTRKWLVRRRMCIGSMAPRGGADIWRDCISHKCHTLLVVCVSAKPNSWWTSGSGKNSWALKFYWLKVEKELWIYRNTVNSKRKIYTKELWLREQWNSG